MCADDLGFNEVGFRNGTRGIQTPHLDRLAGEGVILDRYYTAPLCSASRSSLMTGLYPHRIGTQSNVIYWDTPWAPARSLRFLPEVLKREAGYGATAAFGKWHLGMYTTTAYPTSRGFDTFFGFMQGGGSHGTHVSACVGPPPDPTNDTSYVCAGPVNQHDKDYRGYDWFRDAHPDFSVNGTSSTKAIRDAAVAFVTAHANDSRPFFLYLPFQNAHEPIACSQAAYDRFRDLANATAMEKLLFGYIWDMDQAVGDVVSAAPLDRTLVVFVSDNGAPPELGAGGRNWPLAGFKSQTLEGGVRVPAFVYGPGRVPSRKVVSSYVHVTDWLPTLLAAAGVRDDVVTAISVVPLDGTNAWPALTTNATSRLEFVVNISPLCTRGGQMNWPKAALVQGDLKLVCSCFAVKGVDRARFTGCVPPVLLFNISADPGETRDLGPAMPQAVAKLSRRLVELAVPHAHPMQVSTSCSEMK
jgi:arylsulfatase A-like enzyme